MGITHVVMFEFQPLATQDDIQGVCSRMLALQEKCVHPQTKKQYIKTATGGIDSSPEGKQNGITHVFISEFSSEEDRKYYLEEDPAHLEFGKSIAGIVAKAQVVDFTPGVFGSLK